ncbi:MAG: hypothetical protein HS115_18980 [Spirochaetales bacterium]|nr:hypothetical protein [Spirochaetales bacterium]
MRRRQVSGTTLLIAGLYISFLTADIWTGDPFNLFSRIIKYLSILLCLSLTLSFGQEGHDRRDKTTLRVAFMLTAIADLVIGISGYFVAGVSVFFLVQLVYILRHSRGFVWNRNEIISGLIVLAVVGAIFFYIHPGLLEKGLFWPVLVYSLALGTSLWLALGTMWRKFFPRPASFFIAAGMLAFFLCDLSLGLSSGPDSRARILVWFFYLPAQLLLALSGYRVAFLGRFLGELRTGANP